MRNSKIIIENEFNTNENIIYHKGYADKFIETIPDKSIKLIITSPPYNLGKEYETKTTIEKYLNTQEKVIQELIRVLTDDGSICWQVGNYVNNGEVFPLDIYYYNIFKKYNLFLRNRVIWHFGHGLHAQKRFSGRYETVLWFTKSDKYTFNLDSVRVPSKYPGKRYYKGPKKGQISGNPKGKNPSDVWEILCNEWETGILEIPNVKANHPEKTIHPCQFPIELVERFVLALTNENDFVLDPYAGVGSSILAAIKNNRKAIGIEKEKKYVDIGKKRIESFYQGTLRIRPIEKKIYQPTGKEKIAQIPKEWLLSK